MRIRYGRAALDIVDDMVGVYADVFTAPPWNEGPDDVADFRRRLAEDVDRPGFRAVVSGTDGFATAFTTTLPLPEGNAYAGIADHLGPERLPELLDGACEVNELAVRASARGRGLGRRLLDEVVGDAVRAWLVTSRDAPGAVAFYRRAGWHEVPPLPGAHGDLVVFARPGPPGDRPQAPVSSPSGSSG